MRPVLLLFILLTTVANSCDDQKQRSPSVVATDSSTITAPIPEPKGMVLFGVGVIITALALGRVRRDQHHGS